MNIFNLTLLAELSEAAGQFIDDAGLPLAQLAHINLRRGKVDAPVRRFARFRDDFGDVQQGLRRNAAAIEADAAGVQFHIDKRRLQSEIGSHEGGSISARPAADDDHLRRVHVVTHSLLHKQC